MLAAAAADIDAELILERAEPALERTDQRGRYARGVPVHPHHGAERLEPERMRQPLKERVAPVMMHDRLRHDRAERGHTCREPGWNPAVVQGKIGAAGSSGHDCPEIAQFGDGCTSGMLHCTERGSAARCERVERRRDRNCGDMDESAGCYGRHRQDVRLDTVVVDRLWPDRR